MIQASRLRLQAHFKDSGLPAGIRCRAGTMASTATAGEAARCGMLLLPGILGEFVADEQ